MFSGQASHAFKQYINRMFRETKAKSGADKKDVELAVLYGWLQRGGVDATYASPDTPPRAAPAYMTRALGYVESVLKGTPIAALTVEVVGKEGIRIGGNLPLKDKGLADYAVKLAREWADESADWEDGAGRRAFLNSIYTELDDPTLLEKRAQTLAERLALAKAVASRRGSGMSGGKLSAYQHFMKQHMRNGYSMSEAARMWSGRSKRRSSSRRGRGLSGGRKKRSSKKKKSSKRRGRGMSGGLSLGQVY